MENSRLEWHVFKKQKVFCINLLDIVSFLCIKPFYYMQCICLKHVCLPSCDIIGFSFGFMYVLFTTIEAIYNQAT